jgi:hypothetical protein
MGSPRLGIVLVGAIVVACGSSGEPAAVVDAGYDAGLKGGQEGAGQDAAVDTASQDAAVDTASQDAAVDDASQDAALDDASQEAALDDASQEDAGPTICGGPPTSDAAPGYYLYGTCKPLAQCTYRLGTSGCGSGQICCVAACEQNGDGGQCVPIGTACAPGLHPDPWDMTCPPGLSCCASSGLDGSGGDL